MLSQDFYPTPRPLIERMLTGVDLDLVKHILEPSAGKGDICDYLTNENDWNHRSRAREIDVIEIEPELRMILRGKEYNVVHDNFLTFETRKAYDLILANFPFSDGDRHLQRALDLLERSGGALVCLVNAETIRNPYTNLRTSVVATLTRLGATIEYVPDAFTDAERKTNVEVALVRVAAERPDKPSLLLDALREADAPIMQDERERSDVVGADPIAAMVARFNVEARVGSELIDEYYALLPFISQEVLKPGENADAHRALLELEIKGNHPSNRFEATNSYLEELRGKYWRLLLSNPQFSAAYTSNITDELHERIDELKRADFTLFNIRELEKELRVNIRAGIEAAILKLFDKLSHENTYNENVDNGNIHYFNGWKSNRAHKVNGKVVIPFYGFERWDGKLDWYRVSRFLSDTMKVFRYLECDETDISQWVTMLRNDRATSGLNCRYFSVSFYKKGTAHVRFKDQRLLDKFNIFAAQKRNWLPPSYGKKTYSDMAPEERAVVDEFQGEAAYRDIMAERDYYLVDDNALLLSADLTPMV